MTLFHVAVRGLRHYAGTAFATSAGVAVAACVIGGSIIAGDSVTATLRRSALARLGSADYAVAAAHPISHVLARALADTPGVTTAAPVLIRNGSAQNADTDATAPRVQVIGAGPEFSALYPANRRVPSLEPREAAVSAALASDIGLTVGSGFILRVATGSGEPVSSIFARRALSDAIRTMRVECKAILPPDGPGGFSLGVESGARRNVIVDADWLAGQLDGDRVVDAVLLDADTVAARGAIGKVVRDSSAPADFGLAIEVDAPRGAVLVRGTDVTIPAARAEALLGGNRSAAVPAGTAGSIMLATRLASARGAAHYAVVGHVPTVPVEEDRIVLNRWLADDLRAEAGGTINVEWLRPKPDGSYEPQSRRMIVSRIVAVEAAAEQQWIAPQFKGITDSERMTDWDPPFPVDLSLITPRDDLYWDRYRTTPKAFVSREAIRRMWGAEGASGEWVTAVRFGLGLPRAQGSGSDLRALSAAVEGLVRTDARIREGGPIVRPIREEALVAARGSSDFRGLMLGMSMFIVASGIALAGMLMRLSAERRASQMGVMLAMGFAPSSAARVTVIEGGFAALGGALIGAVLGAPFAAALVRALNSWWAGAVAGEPIVLTVGPGGPLIGACAAFGLGMAAAWASARRLVRSDVLRLLAGWRG
ncbi:MAG: FtsX-like permease family protein, partial [Armatimonadetes bacterium]|nr:FtsX-like permease family protein [Armatimonadota bacterium]